MQLVTSTYSDYKFRELAKAHFFRSGTARLEADSASTWRLPEVSGWEYDQYDTPASTWIVVQDQQDRVLAAARLTPTTARCGIYSYFLRDAQKGLLSEVPSNCLFEEAPIEEGVWEVSRLFLTDASLGSGNSDPILALFGELSRKAIERGATQVIGLLPQQVVLRLKEWGYDLAQLGPELSVDGKAMSACSLALGTSSAQLASARQRRTKNEGISGDAQTVDSTPSAEHALNAESSEAEELLEMVKTARRVSASIELQSSEILQRCARLLEGGNADSPN